MSTTLTFILLIAVAIFAMYAQFKVTGTYNRYVRVPSRGRITGAEAAEAMLRRFGVSGVTITSAPGHLIDHYDPSKKRLVLSEENYHGDSLAALGVAAHEAGHAIQHKVGYRALRLRMALVPATMIASQFLPFVVLGGFIFGFGANGSPLGRILLDVGIITYAVLTFFHLVTLPVEYDASRRAKEQLVGLGVLARDEMVGVERTLNAAALTYVAAFLSSALHLIHLILLRQSQR
jgi:Zn-dependent membrane protease YugP